MALVRPRSVVLSLGLLASAWACTEDIPKSAAFAYQTKAQRLDAAAGLADSGAGETDADVFVPEAFEVDLGGRGIVADAVAPDVPHDTDADATADLPPACTPGTCEDGNACTADTCKDGACGHTPKDGPCEDGEPCTEPDLCAAGKCAWGPKKDCDDFNKCTDDACKTGTGCVYTPSTTLCKDGNPCTVDDCVPEIGCKFTDMDDGLVCKSYADCTIGYCIAKKCEVQDVLWTKTLGNDGKDDEARVVQAIVTDWVVAGSVGAAKGSAAAVWKLDMAGNEQWFWSSASLGSDRFDGGVYESPWMVLVGTRQMPDKQPTGLFAKVNGMTGTVGTVVDVGVAEKSTSFRAVAPQTTIGQYAAVGKTASAKPGSAEVWLVLLDAGGKLLKQVTWGTPDADDAAVSVVPLKNGYAVGSTLDQGTAEAATPGQDIEVSRHDLQGAKLWSVGPKQPGVQFDPFLAATSDDGVVVAATVGVGPEGDLLAVKVFRLDAAGKIVWGTEALAKAGARQATAVRLAPDGAARVVGFEVAGGETDGWMAAFTLEGGLQWSQTLGLPGGEKLYALDPSASGRFAAAGAIPAKSGTDALVRRMDQWGVATCAQSGACATKGVLECQDGKACTADLCTGAAGCKHEPLPAGQPCASGKACDGKGFCVTLG